MAKGGKLADLRRKIGARIEENIGKPRNGQGGIAPVPKIGPTHPPGVVKAAGVLEIPLELIEPDPDQPRKTFDEEALDRLGETLKKRGQLQPARVVFDPDRKRYVVLCGERRWRAAKRAGLKTLVCVVLEAKPSREEALIDQLLENCAREGLGPLELAEALADLEKKELGRRRIAEETGLSRAAVDRSLALHGQPGEVRALVAAGKLAPTTAYELRKLPPRKQEKMAQMVVEKNLSRDRLREFISYGETTSERIENQVAHSGPPGIGNGLSEIAEPIKVPVSHGGTPEVERNETMPDLTEEQTVMAALDAAGGGLPSRPVKAIPETRGGGRRDGGSASPPVGAGMDAGPGPAPEPDNLPVIAGTVWGAGGDLAAADAGELEEDLWQETSDRAGWYCVHGQLTDRTGASFRIRSGEGFEQAVRRLLASYREATPPEAGARVRIDWPSSQDHGLEGYVESFRTRDDHRVVRLDREPGESGSVCRPFPLRTLEVVPDDEGPDPAGEEAGDGDL